MQWIYTSMWKEHFNMKTLYTQWQPPLRLQPCSTGVQRTQILAWVSTLVIPLSCIWWHAKCCVAHKNVCRVGNVLHALHWSNGSLPLNFPENKIHGANVGSTWGRQDPGGPHFGHMNLLSVLHWCNLRCMLASSNDVKLYIFLCAAWSKHCENNYAPVTIMISRYEVNVLINPTFYQLMSL